MSESTAKLEPFLIFARSTKGPSAAQVIIDATAAPGLYTFSELLALTNIQALSSDASYEKQFNLLNLFAYGTFPDYLRSKDSYPTLTVNQITKLKHLTLVSLAHKQRTLAYDDLLSSLQISSVRELEDLIIDVIYLGLLGGKIHHHQQVLHIDWVSGRDVGKDDLIQMKNVLDNWCHNASTLLSALDAQINQARSKSIEDALHAAEYARARDEIYRSVVKTGWQNVLNDASKKKGGADGMKKGGFVETEDLDMEIESGLEGGGRMPNLYRSAEQHELPILRASKRSKD